MMNAMNDLEYVYAVMADLDRCVVKRDIVAFKHSLHSLVGYVVAKRSCRTRTRNNHNGRRLWMQPLPKPIHTVSSTTSD